MPMINLDNVTLISMTSVDINNTVKALEYSCKDISFACVKLVTDFRGDISTNINICSIDRMNNIDDYSYNMVYKLHEYIDTDFALIIQSDGYVINPNKWISDFLEYDYIGAPWGIPIDNFSMRDPFGNIIRVGNGGFSLRSKKLLSLPSRLNLEWKSYYGYYNEDGFFTCHNRHLFEKEGCKFAPIEIASLFSQESEIPENQGIIPFGFHGKWSKWNKNL